MFRAFTDPVAIARWLTNEGDTTKVVELDLREGGRYVFRGTYPGGDWEVRGVYLEVSIPERLVFSWSESMSGRPDSGETLVTVTFRERGAQTEILLTHEKDETEATRREHEDGWKAVSTGSRADRRLIEERPKSRPASQSPPPRPGRGQGEGVASCFDSARYGCFVDLSRPNLSIRSLTSFISSFGMGTERS